MEKPILLNTPMVKAVLEGRKTQIRIIIKPQPNFDSAWRNLGSTDDIPVIRLEGDLLGINEGEEGGVFTCVPNVFIPWHKGDTLWVRETFTHWNGHYQYKASTVKGDELGPWKPSIHMPKAACRIFLEITNIRVERLQYISEEDAINEGVESDYPCGGCGSNWNPCLGCRHPFQRDALRKFKSVWSDMHSHESWDSNPWVWVIEFKRVIK